MGQPAAIAGQRDVKMRHEPRKKRALRKNLVRAAVWVFLLFFIASIAGVAIVASHQ